MNNKFIYSIGLGLILLAGTVNAGLPSDKTVIHAVVMEASGEPYMAQVGICAVIRNRDSLQGVYGAKAHRHESEAVYAQIGKAWRESATNDITHGCTKFGGTIDDHYFIDELHLKPVLTIGHTRFYK